jgi:hypothetical protein
MIPDVYQADGWQVETSSGTEIVPADITSCRDGDDPEDVRAALADYVIGKIRDDEDPALIHNMWLARLSAPGYLWYPDAQRLAFVAGTRYLSGSRATDVPG